jgi:hypothetical protein
MPRTRPFQERDIPEVADLWFRVFRRAASGAPRSLHDYFAEVFFRNPWRDEALPSLVYEDGGGAAAGFLGVLPRRMTFRGRPVRVAVSTQLMVHPARRHSLAALHLMRDFFAGPQDLSFTDGANDASQRLWESLGGTVAMLHSLEWTRVLRPTRHIAGILSAVRSLVPLVHAAAPVCGAMDAAVARLPFGPYHVPPSPLASEDATVQTLHACLTELGGRPALRPVYDSESLAWLLSLAEQKRAHGRLRKVVIRDGRGRIAGWYLYYLKPGGASQVVQVGARDGSAGQVLDALFHDAACRGAVSVGGQLEPSFVRQLSDRHCVFRCLSLGVLIHSKDRELLQAIQRGDAFLSRLEGEWWLRFGRDRFE